MKYIALTQGKRVKVDDADYEWLSKHKWCYASNRSGYAIRQVGTFRHSKHEIMARAIMRARKGQVVDHISGDTLDNRRENLRLCTNRENVINSKMRSDNTSGYRGVGWSKQKMKWQARINVHGKLIHLGFYTDKDTAATMYNRAALDHFGKFARLNFLGGRKPGEQSLYIAGLDRAA